MKKKIYLLYLFFALALSATAQNITEAEYFWDTDPGAGNAIPLAVLDGNFDSALEGIFSNNVTLPSVGNHVLGVRVKSTDGNWGTVYRKVLKVNASNSTNLLGKVTQAEYFWDIDPGAGSGITLLAFDGNFDAALESVFSNNVTLPITGNHVLGVRVKSTDGNWGTVYRKVFKVDVNNNTNLLGKITQAEYFWDTDPGAGSGITLLAFDGNFNAALESVFSNNVALPSAGDHVLGVRVKSTDGNWGTVYQRVFKVDVNNNSNLLCKITQAEYFWDIDPGTGSGITLLAFDGNFNTALEQLSHSSTNFPASGLHLLNVRTKSDDGNWGVVFQRVVGVDLIAGDVTLNSPLDNATCRPLTDTLKWNSVLGIGEFEYELATDISFTTITHTGTVTDTIVEITTLLGGTNYFWRVRAKNGIQFGLWSTIWNFTTEHAVNIAETVCSGSTFIFGTQALTIAGNYIETFTASNGCDSTVTLNLSFSNGITNSIAETICGGTSYTFGTQTLTNAGTYTEVFTTSGGCDSTVTLSLTVTNITSSIAETICGGTSYIFGTQILTNAGTYTEVFTTSGGCDSTVTLSLTVTNITSSIAETICGGTSYTFGTQTLTNAGTYTEVFTASGGCDSTVTLSLTVTNITSSIAETICGGTSYTFGTQTLTNAGTYTEVFTASGGCDSTVTLNLSVINLNAIVTYSGTILSATSASNYQWYLDGTEVVGETSQTMTPLVNGCYSVEISEFGCSDTSNCFDITEVSILENRKDKLTIYPNPTNSILNIDIDKNIIVNTILIDVNGKIVLESSNTNQLNLVDLPKGIYILSIETVETIYQRRVIKQ